MNNLNQVERTPTPEAIMEAAYCLYSCPDEGFSDMDAAAVSSILKAKVKQGRQILSLWTILKSYQAKLASLGYDWNALVPPQQLSKTEVANEEIVLGATVSLKKVDAEEGPMVAVSVPYDPKLVDLIKTLKSRRWNKERKVWLIPYSPIDVEIAIATFKAEKLALDIDPVLKELIEAGKASYQKSRAESAEITIPTKIELYPFQKAGVKWIDDHNGRALVGDDMGLGKSPEALGYLVLRPERTLPALILCPSLVRVHWDRMVRSFTDLKPLLVVGKTSRPSFAKAKLDVSDRPLPGYDVTVTNYDLLSVETPRIWLRQLLKAKTKEDEAYPERHLGMAGMQAIELLKNSMNKYKDIQSRNRIHRVIEQIENQGKKARRVKADPEYQVVYVNGVPFEEFVKAGYKTLICDESQYCKNPDAQRTVAALEISGIVQNSICLTGTPIDNAPRELWTQIQIVNKNVAPKWFDFGVRYCNGYQKPAGGKMVWDFSGVSNIAELDKMLRSTIMIRRTKDQVMKELPPKTRTMIPFIVESGEDKEYRKGEPDAIERLRKIRKERLEWKALMESLSEADRKIYIAKHAERAARASGLKDLALNEIEALKDLAVNAKFQTSVDFICTLKETQGKILIFAVHHKTIDRLVAAFREKGFKTDYIDGRVTGMSRQNVIDAFQEHDLEVLVCGIRAVSIGATLTASHTVVFIELDWTPGIHSQAEDRTYRIGQSKPVTVYYLLLLGSVEEKIAKMIDSKREVVNSILGEGDRSVQETGILDAVLDELLDGEKAA